MKTKKQFTNRILSLMLSLVMVLGLLPTRIISASATSDHTHHFEDAFWDFDSNGHWHRCIAEECEITDYSATNEVDTAYGVHADSDIDGICDICDYHIEHEHTGWTELTSDVLVTNSYTLGDGKYYLPDNLNTTQKIFIDGNVCLCLNGKIIKANASMSNPYHVIEIKADSTLDLYDCSGTHAGKITGGSARNGSGVIGYGTFRMFGGTITENNKDRTTKDDSNGDGAAVYVNTEFVMYDGIISSNRGDWGGGVFTVNNSSFTMYGGTITANIASGRSGSAGGGVCAAGKTFDMYGGTISGNYGGFRSGGVYVGTNTTFNMYGGEISNNGLADDHHAKAHGGGVAFLGTFNMYGGRIYNNNAVYGGGVASYYSKNTFNMSGGKIYNNTATYGGGVCIGEVNTSVDNVGFNMSGGKIYGNKADTVGGVYVGSKGLFDMSGGEITNNIATGEIGGGVFIDSDSVSFTLSGRPVISENKKGDYNTDIVLAGDKKITINDELTTDSPIGVMLLSDNLPATGDFTKNWSTHMSTADCNVHFFSNDDNYGVKQSENGEELELYALPEHRDWIYSKTGNVITATCGISGCTQSGGSVTLNVSDAYYTGNAIGATVQGSFTNGATHKITYDNGSETAPSSVGTHIVKLTVFENGTEKQSLTLQYKIDYLPASENAYTISNAETKIGDVYWFKNQPVIVLAPEGYTIGTGLDGSYSTSIEYYEGDDFVFYLKRQSDGAMTDGIDFSQQIRFDSTAPTGKIAVGERNFWAALINKITFGWFFKGEKTAHITATDMESGVKNIEYFVSDRDLIADKTLSHMDTAIRLEAAVGNHWATYNNDIALNNNSKNVIYAKITDNVGNISYISSDGIVLYTDSTSADFEKIYTYTSMQDVEYQIVFNGNTLDMVKVDNALLSQEDYTVTTNGIKIEAAYLENLSLGEHDITVYVSPLGEKFNYGIGYGNTLDTIGDTPATLSFMLEIKKSDQTAPNVGKTDETISQKADGKITDVDSTMEYRADCENTYTAITGSTVENLAAGKYYVRVKGDGKHNQSPDVEVTIAAGRMLTVTLPQVQVGYTLTVDKTEFAYNDGLHFTFKLHDGYTMTDDFSAKFNNMVLPLHYGNVVVDSCIEDAVVTVEGIADITSPTAEIKVKNNKWTSFLNNLTFGLFFKESQDVTITAYDAGSGVKSVQYYLSDRELERSEVNIIADWVDYNGTFKINYDNEYVIYAKITDHDGNVEYINSEGIVLDATAPVLYGIENGGVYHGDKVFKAMDKNFLKIEVDGLDITDTTEGDDEFKIVADNAEHTVTVTDKAGNVTEYKITVYKKYMVTYTNGDGGSYEKEFKYGEVITIPTNEIFKDTFRKTGHTIKEWQGYTEGMTMPLKDLTFTAVYAPCEYTVTFDQNGGEVINPITVMFGEKYGSLPSSAIMGLSGGNKNWYLVDANGNVTETNIKNLTLVSTARDHKLFIKRNVLAPSVSVALTVPGGISDGYQYYISGASKRVLTASIGNMNTDILEYTYRWYKDGTLIGGATSNVLTLDGNVSDSGTYKVEVTATLKDGTNIVVGSDMATASKEQKVKILHATNTLCYDANGGEGGPQSFYTGGTALNVSKDVPTRAHYDFIGWNTAPDGTGDSYKAEDVYTFVNDNGNGGCEVTLYAQWKLVEYTVTYMADGELLSTEMVGHGKDATLPAVPTKDGYVGKWDSDGKNIAGDTTITAVYTALPVVKPDEVKPEDKTNLEDVKAKLEEMLEDDSYTDDDKKDIQDAIDDIDDALEVIGNVEAVEELIDMLPDTIKKDDEPAIKAADDAYNALSDYEKSLVDEDAKKALDDAKAVLAELNKPADTDSLQTGDNSNMFLWIALLFISGGAVTTLTVVDRKRRTAKR